MMPAPTACMFRVRYAVVSFTTNTGAEVNRVPAAAGVGMLWLDPESRRYTPLMSSVRT